MTALLLGDDKTSPEGSLAHSRFVPLVATALGREYYGYGDGQVVRALADMGIDLSGDRFVPL